MGHKFEKTGQLAIEPSALALTYDAPPTVATSPIDAVAVVCVYGPLMSHADPFFDSYDSIYARVCAALASSANAVVMHFDSPGGLVSGCLATSRALRKAADASGKRLIAYVGESATSAAYALACAAHEIVLPTTGRVGSVGVIEVVPSFARQQQAAGIDVTVLTSGERKSDGHPNILMSDDARAALQLGVDRMAEAFFDLVNEQRPGRIKDVASLQAAVYYGEDAVAVGLADRMTPTFEDLITALTAPQGSQAMTRAELMAGLQALAEGDGDDAEMAKRMLAAEAPPSDDEAPPSSKAAKAAAPDEAPPSSKPAAAAAAKAAKYDDAADGADAKAAALAPLGQTVAALQRKLERLESERKAEMSATRAAIFAARPDVPAALKTALKGASLDECRAALAAIPLPNPAAAASVGSTVRGEGQGDGTAGRLPPAQKHALDVAMGLAKPKMVNRMVGNKYEMGVLDYEVAADTSVPGIPQTLPDKVI